MSKSKEYIEGFKAGLQAYSWMDNFKQLRVGIPGVLLNDAIAKIESEVELDVTPLVDVPVNVEEEPHKKSHHKAGQY